jgi:ABC-type sugar transport system permease subunit
VRFLRRNHRQIAGFLFVLPWIIGFLVFTAYPLATAVLYSFSKVSFPLDGIKLESVGIQNYTTVMVSDPDFKLALSTYLTQLVCYVPMVLVFSCMLAMLLNSDIRMRQLVRAIFFLPVIIMSGPVLASLKEMGAVTLQGLDDFPVYEFIAKYLPPSVSAPILYVFDHAVVILWYCGVPILIFLSGLQKMDRSMYEAAMVDGASAWQRFWKLTIPTLRPFFFLNGVFSVVEISMSTQNPIIKLIKDGLFQITRGFGFSAAVSMLYFLIIIVSVLLLYLFFGREKRDIIMEVPRRMVKS